MAAYSSSVSKETSAGVSAGGYGVEASVSASFSSANSSARQSSGSARKESKTKQMTTSAIASLYTFALRQGTEQTFLSEDFTKDLQKIRNNQQAFEFIRIYGSHYLKRAKMGARFQENIYFSEEAT